MLVSNGFFNKWKGWPERSSPFPAGAGLSLDKAGSADKYTWYKHQAKHRAG